MFTLIRSKDLAEMRTVSEQRYNAMMVRMDIILMGLETQRQDLRATFNFIMDEIRTSNNTLRNAAMFNAVIDALEHRDVCLAHMVAEKRRNIWFRRWYRYTRSRPLAIRQWAQRKLWMCRGAIEPPTMRNWRDTTGLPNNFIPPL